MRKSEIIRGYSSFTKILNSNKYFSAGILTGLLAKAENGNSETNYFNPLSSKSLKVGFIISKRKFGRAVLRNRIRRIIKEAYRLNRSELSGKLDTACDSAILIGVKENEVKRLIENDALNYVSFVNDMKLLLNKVSEYLNTIKN